ncbi:MAG: hypothetical protein QNJ94_18700 [Alphaproteobacteria bacterium]|nr:hypothetical protein [Alphaproteobacteria bacterium]
MNARKPTARKPGPKPQSQIAADLRQKLHNTEVLAQHAKDLHDQAAGSLRDQLEIEKAEVKKLKDQVRDLRAANNDRDAQLRAAELEIARMQGYIERHRHQLMEIRQDKSEPPPEYPVRYEVGHVRFRHDVDADGQRERVVPQADRFYGLSGRT